MIPIVAIYSPCPFSEHFNINFITFKTQVPKENSGRGWITYFYAVYHYNAMHILYFLSFVMSKYF